MARYIKSDDQTFEFDDDVPDEEAMNAIDSWTKKQPKYSQEEMGGLLEFVKGLFDGKIGISDIAKGTVEGLKELPDLLELAVNGKNKYTDPLSESYNPDYGRTQETAIPEILSGIAMGGRTFGTGGPATLGTFAGKRAIPKAQQIGFKAAEAAGSSKDQLWKDFGIFRGPDGKLRTEIADDKSNIIKENLKYEEHFQRDFIDPNALKGLSKEDKLQKIRELQKSERYSSDVVSLDKIIKHDNLFKLYPELKKVNVLFNSNSSKAPGGTRGSQRGNFIEVNVKDLEEGKSVLLHEIQHKIQDIEDFAKGGSGESFMYKKNALTTEKLELQPVLASKAEEITGETFNEFLYKNINEGWNQETAFNKYIAQAAIKDRDFAKEALDYGDLNRLIKKFDKNFPADEQGRMMIGKEPNEIEIPVSEAYYRDLYGEIESRNVQKRMNYDSRKRGLLAPYKTEDKPVSGGRVLDRYTKEKE